MAPTDPKDGMEPTGDGPQTANGEAAAEPAAAGYDAVVYFHGMGEQRRHEELSRLVDALDVFAHRAAAGGDEQLGTLRKIRVRFEEARDERLPDMTYLRVIRDRTTERGREYSSHRFYEVYWAPVTAGGRPAREVLFWLLRKTAAPVRMLLSPWRSRPRLHRAALFGLWRDLARVGRARDGDLEKLVREYNRFERPDSRRDYPTGSFGEFVSYLGVRFAKKRPETHRRLVRLARRWRRRFIWREIALLLVLVCLGLTLLWGVVALAGGLLAGLRALAGTGLAQTLSESGAEALAARIRPSWGNALLALAALASVFGVTRFVGRYVGDVQFWASYSETDEKHAKRSQILEQGAAVLSHVLQDPKCQRVTVVGHSLGSAIAMECLLELGRYNRARRREAPMLGPLPLEKIRHFVTLGSPIDKIHYFFESHHTPYHRYVRVFDDVRGDLGEVPFAKNRKPHIHWVNVWDRADLVSGPLDSPTNGRMPWLAVDNVEVSSFPFPDPAASHSAYFQEPAVVALLYRLIFDNWCAFDEAPRDDMGRPDYRAVEIGPGRGRRATRWLHAALLALPVWLGLVIGLTLADRPIGLILPFLALIVATGGVIGGGLALNGLARKSFL